MKNNPQEPGRCRRRHRAGLKLFKPFVVFEEKPLISGEELPSPNLPLPVVLHVVREGKTALPVHCPLHVHFQRTWPGAAEWEEGAVHSPLQDQRRKESMALIPVETNAQSKHKLCAWGRV